jgi:hypothetical protein
MITYQHLLFTLNTQCLNVPRLFPSVKPLTTENIMSGSERKLSASVSVSADISAVFRTFGIGRNFGYTRYRNFGRQKLPELTKTGLKLTEKKKKGILIK